MSLNQKIWSVKYVEKPELPKNKVVNAGRYSFSYCPLNYVDEVLTPLFEKYRLGWRWECSTTTSEGAFVNLMTVVVFDIDSPETITSQLFVSDYDDEFQEIGKRLTYLSRYLLLLVLGLVADEDTDVGESENLSPSRSRQNRATAFRRNKPAAPRQKPEEDEPLEWDTGEDEEEEEEEKKEIPAWRRIVESNKAGKPSNPWAFPEDDEDEEDGEDDEDEDDEEVKKPPVRRRTAGGNSGKPWAKPSSSTGKAKPWLNTAKKPWQK